MKKLVFISLCILSIVCFSSCRSISSPCGLADQTTPIQKTMKTVDLSNKLAQNSIFGYHSISFFPINFKYSFVFVKCLDPNQPLHAPSGEGCGAVNILCFDVFMNAVLLSANFHQSRKIIFSFLSEISFITALVKVSHPLF